MTGPNGPAKGGRPATGCRLTARHAIVVHHEAGEFRVHYREAIPDGRRLCANRPLRPARLGQVVRMNAGWLVTRPPGSRPTLQRFWGTVVRTARRPTWFSSSMIAVSSFPSRDESLHDRACASGGDAVGNVGHLQHYHDVQQGSISRRQPSR
jgi:hypothetical protein